MKPLVAESNQSSEMERLILESAVSIVYICQWYELNINFTFKPTKRIWNDLSFNIVFDIFISKKTLILENYNGCGE